MTHRLSSAVALEPDAAMSADPPFKEVHLTAFVSSIQDDSPVWAGSSPRSWANWLLEKKSAPIGRLNVERLPESVSRNDLYAYASDEGIADLELAVMVLAWGGMRRNSALAAFHHWDEWGGVIAQLRRGEIDSFSGYESFRVLRRDGRLTGMGPAYFTKLIFFCHPQHNGYIMDQWTARSINLLIGHKAVLVSRLNQKHRSKTVTDKNNMENYRNFCSAIENLTVHTGLGESTKTEEKLFSAGRRQGSWRNHVVENDL